MKNKRIITLVVILGILFSVAIGTHMVWKAFTGPIVSSITPVNGATNVAVDNTIIVKFNKAVVNGSNYNNLIIKTSSGAAVDAATTINNDTLTIKPDNDLVSGTSYIVTIPAGAVNDSEGTPLTELYSLGFTVVKSTPPTVVSTIPASGASNTALNSSIAVKFSETVLSGVNFNGITLIPSGGTAVNTAISISNDTLTIKPDNDLVSGTSYTVTIPAGAVNDSEGTPLAVLYSFGFTAVIIAPPMVVSTVPANGATIAALDSSITVKFSEAVSSASTFGGITLIPSGGTAVNAVISISNDIMTIKPGTILANNTKYTVTITACAVKGASDIASASQYAFSFTTIAPSAFPRIVGYVQDFYKDSNSLKSSQIQYSKITYINYAFLEVNPNGSLVNSNITKMQKAITAAHQNGVKILISAGGSSNTTMGTAVVNNLSTVVSNLETFMNIYDFDGIDIDWEMVDSAQTSAFTSLMQTLYTDLHSNGKLITCCLDTGDWYGMNISSRVFSYIDFANVMCYDSDGNQHSPYTLAESGLNYWVGRGLPKGKINIGIPFYGYNGTSRKHEMPYNTIIENYGIDAAYLDSIDGYNYNGIPTILQKTQLAKDNGCGIMIWNLTEDTTDNTSLLSAVYNRFRS